MDGIWFTFLYQPLFNALIWIYNNIGHQNLGWAVVWLTIILRVILLPLTIVSERNAVRHEKMEREAAEASLAFRNDPIAQKEEFRRIMRRNKVSPWAKVLTLGIQVLVLLLLYQVFMRGITGEKVIKVLYPIIDFPGKINVMFYGFNIGAFYTIFWPAVVAVYLFMSIFLEHRGRKMWEKSEVVFLFMFPLFSFVALWALPMVKSLFILTSMMFSDTIHLLRVAFYPNKKEKSAH